MWGQDILPGSIHELGIFSTGPGCLWSVGEARQCIMSQSSWTHSAQEMSPQGPAAKSQSFSAVGERKKVSGTGGSGHPPALGSCRVQSRWVAVLNSSMHRALVPADFTGFINIYMEKHLKLSPASQMWKTKMLCSLCGLSRAGGPSGLAIRSPLSPRVLRGHRRHQANPMLEGERGAT